MTKRVGNNPRIKLLTLHGGPGATHEYFEAFDSYLPAAGVEYYYYDQLGSAYSDQPDDPSLLVITRFVEEVEQVRRALGLTRDDFYLLGHSWGGILALEYALAHQQDLKGLVISNMMASIPAYNEYAKNIPMQGPSEMGARGILVAGARLVMNVDAGDDDLSGGRGVERRGAAQQGRLAGAVRPDQRGDGVGLDGERHAVERAMAGIVEDEIADDDERVHGPVRCSAAATCTARKGATWPSMTTRRRTWKGCSASSPTSTGESSEAFPSDRTFPAPGTLLLSCRRGNTGPA